MGTLIYLLLIAAIVLGIIAVITAVMRRAWTPWATGAAIAFVIWLVLTLVVK